MISLCVVTLDRLKNYLDIFLESVLRSTKHVREVLIVNVERDKDYAEEWTEGGIRFRTWGGRHDLFEVNGVAAYCAQHAYGLHLAEAEATQEFVWFSDPDIWFYDYVDDHYLGLMGRHYLHFIGVSRPQAVCNGQGYFPGIMNVLVRKKHLPPEGFPAGLKSWSKLSSKYEDYDRRVGKYYLFPDSPEAMLAEYPNPSGHMETGCNLYLWAKIHGMRWLAFQTPDGHNYGTGYHRSNFKLEERLEKKKLLYHASLAATREEHFDDFRRTYELFKETLQ